MQQSFHFRYFLVILTAILYLSSCRQVEKKEKSKPQIAWNATVEGNFSEQRYSTFDSTVINNFLTAYPLFAPYENEIRGFYRHRKYAYAWFERDTLIEYAGNLANQISGLENEGVYSRPPYVKEMDSLLHITNAKNDQQQLELMLTAQYFVFSKMAWDGMNKEESTANNWFLPRKRLSYELYLDSLLKDSGKKQSPTAPVYRQYELLKTFLNRYRSLEKQQQWPVLNLSALSTGSVSNEIVQLRKRLFDLGDFAGDTSSNSLDDSLVVGIRNFQERHGITANGKIDKQTLRELNKPLKERITQILVNMERNRWLPVAEKGEYLAVNIPEFKLHYYRADSLLWSCNVVVGKTMNRTTIFYGEIKYIVFSPYWNVPSSIVKNEILPGIKKNPNYLKSHQMEITGTQDGLPMVRQLPGINNSLGQVKFLFPNSYNIYLHDTPSRSLFNEPSRAFSHGCIRVAEPLQLASSLLKNYPEWTAEKIERAMKSGKETYVTLKEKTPVFIAYFTAFVDRKNKLNFRKDIYQMDEKLASMVISGKGNY